MIEIKPNSLFPNSLSREEGFLKTDPSGSFSSSSRCYGEGRFLLDLCTKRCTKQRCHHFDRGVLLEELRRGRTKVLRWEEGGGLDGRACLESLMILFLQLCAVLFVSPFPRSPAFQVDSPSNFPFLSRPDRIIS